MQVKDRVALITGSGGGIGEGIAKKLAAYGAKVVINDVDSAKVDRVVGEISAAGGEAIGIVVDITKLAEVESMLKQTVDKFGRIDILVNNAGIARDKSIRKLTEEDWDIVMNVNLKGAFFCAKVASEYMREQGYGRIINISSRAWLGGPGQANYSASKGGLVSLTRTLALELGRKGVTANCIAPGLIDTPLWHILTPEIQDRLRSKQPGKEIGTVDDIANGVLFFAGDGASYITGQTIFICGGRSLFAG
jgi:NAD(P)-dependent dehydrogenase (short-subunit alcohol dehydrogenase family)